jgi:hypothetical protein
MAHRLNVSASMMTREELSRFRRSLALLSPYSVRDQYQKALDACRLRDGAPPSPRQMQELVALWKQLWAWRDRRN